MTTPTWQELYSISIASMSEDEVSHDNRDSDEMEREHDEFLSLSDEY